MTLPAHASFVIVLVLALATAAMFNWSWVAQHTITSQLPQLSIRRARWSLAQLFGDRRVIAGLSLGPLAGVLAPGAGLGLPAGLMYIQLSFQRGRALATAGLSSFCTNALPIAG